MRDEKNDLVRKLDIDIIIPTSLGLVERLEEYFNIIN
jgi:hypothetical protein